MSNIIGHDTADMLFTGLMLVLHLGTVATLGYILGRERNKNDK